MTHIIPKPKTYTPEVIESIMKTYQAAPTVETAAQIAKELGVSERSVIAKLSSLGIYKKRGYVTKQGTAPVRKEIYIEKIAELLGIDFSLLECLEKATKQSLTLMEEKIRAMQDENIALRVTLAGIDERSKD